MPTRRRTLLGATAALALLHLPRTSRSAKVARVGVLTPTSAAALLEDALRGGLRHHGYVEGKNIQLDWRRSSGGEEAFLPLAASLVRDRVDLIVALGTPAARAAIQASVSTPVAFQAGDPLGTGLIKSLAHPGGNATGVSTVSHDLLGKRLELLHELAPKATHVALLGNPSNPLNLLHFQAAQSAAQAYGLKLRTYTAQEAPDLDAVLAALAASRPDAFMVTADLFFLGEKTRIVRAIRRLGIPSVYPYREYHDDGVLMSYGYSVRGVARRTAGYVDKILRGAKPSELPVEQLTDFEFIINARLAKETGVRIPESLLARADEIIR